MYEEFVFTILKEKNGAETKFLIIDIGNRSSFIHSRAQSPVAVFYLSVISDVTVV